MRGLIAVLLGVAFTGCLFGQTPPTGARDITQMPQSSQATAPSAVVSAPASVLRVYVDTLGGADPTAIAGLITQALFESKQVVITENQSNASLILKGSIQREQTPSAATASRRSRSRTRTASSAGTAATDSGISPLGADTPVTELPPLADSLAGMDAPVDLSLYRYRLNLQLVNPDGDLIWMSGQGKQALPFQDADDAVQRTLQPMLAVVTQLTPAAH